MGEKGDRVSEPCYESEGGKENTWNVVLNLARTSHAKTKNFRNGGAEFLVRLVEKEEGRRRKKKKEEEWRRGKKGGRKR